MSTKIRPESSKKEKDSSTRDAVERAIEASKDYKGTPWDGRVLRGAMRITRWSEKEKKTA